MPDIFPYQLAGFLSKEPDQGETVYAGKHGWYPQIALKRRFRVDGLSETELLIKVADYCSGLPPLTIKSRMLTRTETMPVAVIEVEPTQELLDFHLNFIDFLGPNLISRYPDRDGHNYYPHITAEYDGHMVIEPTQFEMKEFTLKNIWVLKDEASEDSVAFRKFELGA